ncbi:Predicted thiol-disulfide oxidoreductase YuxK, DCC family [Kaistella treverensis]|uniref:Predicted thiol-disulfide oxidoreductase YuxK, DCC family n=1 Tax=Kaistella treverensis TaxID=631455 RepID=A0A1I3J9X7_9FLAO|nr:DCC1-like thiol-disulfide oxidoreductase family protein [Kaistella treverensis]SFI57003.1 Predicted thiol-disulfide oxidoreductase YuxK, DCC family [Kaistella treverensis]
MTNTDATKYYVFYDGECGFCNFWVHWILKRDDKDLFLFAALQGEFGQKFLSERNLELTDLDTLYLWKPDEYYLRKSHAVFKISEVLGGIYQFISVLRFLPTGITDFLYDRVAENRKKLATQACEIPTPEERKKFIG